MIVVHSAGVEWTVSKKTGALTSWKVGGDERLVSPLEPNFWRAPTQNGKGSGVSGWQQPWKWAGADRQASAFFGCYACAAGELFFDYAEPQENGNRMDVRELELMSADGRMIRFVGAPKFDFSLWPCTVNELEKGWNPHYCRAGESRTLNLDFGQMGVAGEMTWGDAGVPWPKYRLPTEGTLTYSFVLE